MSERTFTIEMIDMDLADLDTDEFLGLTPTYLRSILLELKRCYEEIDTFYPPSGMDVWGEDPNHPRHEWEEEVVAGNVNAGYWHWVSNEKRRLASE